MRFVKGPFRPGFPEQFMEPFFLEGFKRRQSGRHEHSSLPLHAAQLCQEHDVRGMLYFLILAFGALRSCEPLHFFLLDVEFDFWHGSGALIWIWHPETGSVPGELGKWPDRRTYLKAEFGLLPRTEIKGQQHAGFKNLLLEETVPTLGQRSRVYWAVPEIGHLAWHLYQAYVCHDRPRNQSHPYLFSSVWGEAYGAPWTLDAVNRTFRQALGKIGETPSLARGLSMHGFRHRVTHWMRLRGVAPEIRQVALHQKRPESQDAYGRPEPGDIAEALEKVMGGTGRAVSMSTYADLFPLVDQASRLDQIGRNIAAALLGSTP